MHYYAYGSNMSARRLLRRVPSAKFIAVAILREHVLAFHKVGYKDGSGKCDIFKTGDSEHYVMGAILDIDEREKPDLDRIEGLHSGYEEKSVTLTSVEGVEFNAITYYATRINPALRPFHWYKEHVLRGAMEIELPVHYIDRIRAIDSVEDTDPYRQTEEMAIYQPAYLAGITNSP